LRHRWRQLGVACLRPKRRSNWLSAPATTHSIEFRRAVDAVRYAIEAQTGLIERNAGLPPDRRIASGVSIYLGGDVVQGAAVGRENFLETRANLAPSWENECSNKFAPKRLLLVLPSSNLKQPPMNRLKKWLCMGDPRPLSYCQKEAGELELGTFQPSWLGDILYRGGCHVLIQ
jgi:hypothetical protein